MKFILFVIISLFFSCAHQEIKPASTFEEQTQRYQSFQKAVKCEYDFDDFTKFVSFNIYIDAKFFPLYTVRDHVKVTHVCVWGKKGLLFFSECQKMKIDEKKKGYSGSFNLYKDVNEAILDFGDQAFADKFENSYRGDSMSEIDLIKDGNYSDTLTFYASKNKCK